MKYLVSFFILCSFFQGFALAAEEKPNFEFGLGAGALNSEPLFNIDVVLNIPLSEKYTTQVLLNSNYLMTGHSGDSFAQSEFSSNWYLHKEYGRVGVGAGISELKPKDTSKKTDRALIGRFMADAYWNKVTVTADYASYNTTLSNVSSSNLVGASYYITDDQRVSFYRERYNNETGWRLETYFQPKKYDQLGAIGLIARHGTKDDYLGIVARYYFDTAMSLKDRERRYH